MAEPADKGETEPWRPASEAEAASNMAVFVEWLRAFGRLRDASPEKVRLWRQREPDTLLAAIAAFAAADPSDRALLAALAEHLLVAETRAGDTLAWSGDPDASWARAARAAGARVVLVRPTDAAPDGAETPPPSWP